MAGLLDSLKQAFGGQKQKPADDISSVVIDDPDQGFVVVPAQFAQEHGIPALLGIKPSQVPKDEARRQAMTALYRQRKAARIEREKAQEAKRAKADADLAERNKPFLERQAARAAESMAAAKSLPASAQNVLSGVDSVLAKQTPGPAVAPPPEPEPQIDVSPVGQMAAPALPRALPPPSAPAPKPALSPLLTRGLGEDTAPQSLAAIPAPVLKSFAQQRMPGEEPSIPAPMAMPLPRPAAHVADPAQEDESESIRTAPAMFAMPAATETPKAAPARDFAALSQPAPSMDFQPPSPRVTDADRAALLAMAGGRVGSPLAAPAGAMGGDPMGTRTTRMPLSLAAQSRDMNARDMEALKALAAAQRGDDIRAGLGALGNQFEIARDLFLQRTPRPTPMAPGGEGAKQYMDREALLESLRAGRRQDTVADATVKAKGADLAKDTAKAEKDAAAARATAAKDDPTSPESARVRELATSLLGDRIPPDVLAKLSANEIDKVALKNGVSLTNAETMAQLSGERNAQAAANAQHQAEMDAARLAQGWAQLSLAQQKALIDAETNKQNAATKADDKIDAQTKDLQEAYDKTGGPQFYVKFDEASSIMSKYDKDLPGIGALDGRKPEILLSKDGRDLQGAIGGMLAEYRKGITGAGMSDSERTEYGQITGLLYSNSEAAVRQGVERLKRAMDARVQSISGGYKPEAVARYAGRVPDFRSAITGERGRTTPAAGLPTGPDGNPTLDGGAPPAPPTARPVLKPVGQSSSGVKTVNVGGMKGGDLKKSLAEGETVRYPIGNGKYQVVQRKGDRLLRLRVEDK